MAKMSDCVEEALRHGQDAQVHDVYDSHMGKYHGNVEDHRVTEPAAQPKKGASPSPMKLGGK